MASSTHKGWLNDAQNGRLAAVYNGTEVLDFDADDIAFAQNASFAGEINVTGELKVSGAAGKVGYTTGAGGVVTQLTNASTGVTLNTPSGQITTVALTTAAGAEEVFVVTNSTVTSADVVVACASAYAGGGTPLVGVKTVDDGSFAIVITNLHASAALDAVLYINFAVIKGATN